MILNNVAAKQRAFCFVLVLSSFALPLLIPHWHGKLIILLGLLWIITTNWKQILTELKGSLILKLTGLLVLADLIGLIYSANLRFGLAKIESIIPLFMLPLIIISSSSILNGNALRNALIGFVAGVITLNLASLFFISYDLWDSENLQSNLIIANNSIVKIHPAFLSLYISISIFFLLDRYFPLQYNDRAKLGWVLFSMVVLVIYLVWLNSRAGIFGFFVVGFFFTFFRFQGKVRLIFVSALTIMLMAVIFLPFSHARFISSPIAVLQGTEQNVTDGNVSPLINRLRIYECSWKLIEGKEVFYGYGTGDGRDELQNCFRAEGFSGLAEEGLDTHNQYLAEIHSHGIIGLGLFLMLLIAVFSYGVREKSILLQAFAALFAITALFENVLSAQKGIVFFALLCPLLMLYAKQEKQHKPQNAAI